MRFVSHTSSAAAAWGGASGLLVGLAFPPFHLWWLAWVAFVPLLYAVERHGTAGALTAAVAAGLVLTDISLYGLVAYEPLLWLAVLSVQPLWPVLAVALLRGVGVAGWSARAVVAAPVLWVGCELLFQEVLLLPASIGITQARSGAPVQVAEIGGASGLSFLIVLTGALGARAVHRIRHSGVGHGWSGAALAVMVPILAFAYGVLRAPIAPDSDCAARGRVLQPAIPFALNVQSWVEPADRRRIRKWFWEQMEASADSEADLIFWPEGGAAFESFRAGAARERLIEHARHRNQHLFVSAIDFDSRGRKLNSIFTFSPDERIGKYDKRAPVPVAEATVAPGRRSGLIDTTAGLAGLMICYESCFPGQAQSLADRDAAFLVTSANDTALGISAVPGLHLSMGILRAVENRRSMVHASNGGPSAIISPTGEILAKTQLGERRAIEGCIATISSKSVFTRFGHWFAPVCSIASVLLLAGAAVSRRPRVWREAHLGHPASAAAAWAAALLALGLCAVLSLPLAALSAVLVGQRANPPASARQVARSLLPRPEEPASEPQRIVLPATSRSTAVEFLASYYGVQTAEATDGARASGNGSTSLSDLARVAAEIGFDVEKARGNADVLRQTRLPVLVLLQQLGVGVVLEVGSDSVLVFTRATGFESLPLQVFRDLFSGEILHVRPPALEGILALPQAEMATSRGAQ